MSADLAVPKRALAVGAHPDDIEFGCGGTLAKWAAQGCEIFHLVCTDGGKGSWNVDEDVAELVARRQEEQRAAARALGGTAEVVFLGWPDGELECGLRQRVQIASWIRRLRPEAIFGHDPWKRYRLHPDHRNAGFLVTDGIVAARDPLFFPELNLDPHRPDVLLLFEADEPDHGEDITTTFETKIAALLEHTSQFHTTMRVGNAGASMEEETAAFRTRLLDRAKEQGEPHGLALAEAFKRIDRL